MSPSETVKTIFISVAAYRDPELVPTIADCLARAAHPERLRFGICWQHGPEEPALPWASDPRFRVLDVNWEDSRGACWARAEIMKLYEGEDYFMQLDSHHRFADRWDEVAIAEMAATRAEKPALTAYATPFDPAKPDEREHVPMQMNFDRFTDEAIILFRPGAVDNWEKRDRPVRARFLSAHFLFTVGDFVREVPYDPDLYFIGEEITLAVRAYTHGYDLFHPTKMIVWHEYTREYREHKHWTDHNHDQGVKLAWHDRDKISLDKVRAFLESPTVGPFALGTVRTFAEYEAFAGVNFRLRKAQEYTRRFEEPPNPPAAPEWADRIKSYALELAIERTRLPGGVTDYQFWYVGVHDASGLEIFRQDLTRAEVTTLLASDAPQVIINRDFDTERVPSTWTVWPVSDSGGWLDKIEGPVMPLHEPVTLVTALLDIGRERAGAGFERSFNAHYRPKLERLLRVPLPMVIYVPPEHEELVWRHRDPLDTKVISIRTSDLEALPWYGRVQEIRARQDWREGASWLRGSPQATLAHYNPLVLSKMRWLDEAARENPFNTPNLYWIDAGLTHTVSEDLLTMPGLASRLIEATGTFLWVGYPYRAGAEIHGFPRAELVRMAGVAGVDRVVRGGFFGGRADRIGEVAAEYDKLLTSTLDAGLMGTEESLFTILAYRSPEKYSHYMVGSDGLLGTFFDALARGTAHERRSPPVIWPPARPTLGAVSVVKLPSESDTEDAADLARGGTQFMGLPMMQNRHAVPAFDTLWRHLAREGQRVARILVVGTEQGGLAAQLYLYSAATDSEFIAWDQHESTPRDTLFARLGIDLRVKDLSHEFVQAEIAREIQKPGLTVMVCDGADKIRAVTDFAKCLKPGDLILAHDYAASSEAFERQIRGHFWNWCEVTDADIHTVTAEEGLEPLLQDVFARAAWMCRVKRGAKVEPARAAQGTTGSLAVYVLTFNAPRQLTLWFESVVRSEPELLSRAGTRVLLNNSTEDTTTLAYDTLCARYGFDHVRMGNIGIAGGRAWCARHFAERTVADFMIFFEDDMLLHEEAGTCRNGFPTRVPSLIEKAVQIFQNEPGLDFLKLSYTEFYGDHRKNWAFFNLDSARRAQYFPDGHHTRVDAIKSHDGVSYMLGEVYYSNWPMLISRRANDLLFLQDPEPARYEQTLMAHALELARRGQLRSGVLLASPINHDRQVHYGADERKES